MVSIIVKEGNIAVATLKGVYKLFLLASEEGDPRENNERFSGEKPLLHVKVHAANIHDTVSGCEVLEKALEKYPSLKGVCGDAGYRKTMEEFVKKVLSKSIEISDRITPGWAILAKRWVVGRTFACLNHFRRLSKDYEIAINSAENNVMIAHSMILIKRFT